MYMWYIFFFFASKNFSNSNRAQAFVYRFDYRARTQAVTRDVPDWAGVPHMFELPFVWGLPYISGTNIQWNSADKKMTDVMMSMLSAFARNGNPSVSTIKWEPFNDKEPGILIIERNIEMSDFSSVDYKALAFWNDYYPTILDAAINNCCNATNVVSAWRLIEMKSASFALVLLLSLLRLLDDRRLVWAFFFYVVVSLRNTLVMIIWKILRWKRETIYCKSCLLNITSTNL